VLGVSCRECPPHVVGRKLGVANGGHALTPHHVALVLNGEQGNGGVAEGQQLELTELREDLWVALSRVTSRSSPLAMVNQAVMVGSVG
jgi:hypothetical protein